MNLFCLALSGIFVGYMIGCAAKPPAPAPAAPKTVAAAPKPAEPAGPLSVPQTVAKLPAPQPVPEEALASIPEPPPEETPPVGAPLPKPAPRRVPPMGPQLPRGTVTTGPVEAPPVTDTPPAPAAEEAPRPRIQPLVPAEERRRLTASYETRRRQVNDRLSQLQSRPLTPNEQSVAARVRSFMDAAAEAMKRGDPRQADALSERAALLLRELQGVL